MTSLGDRVKAYEACFNTVLPNAVPQVLRLDGRAFHTLTRKLKLEKPFDGGFHCAMIAAAKAVCEDINNARFGYTQSDEISILIYPKYLNSQPYFGNRLNKILSNAASVATLAFYKTMCDGKYGESIKEMHPSFDARLFLVPTYDVNNVFLWRYRDAIKNSVSALAECHFSPKELHEKSTTDRLNMLKEKAIDWNKLNHWERFGTAVIHRSFQSAGKFGPPGKEVEAIVQRSEWAAQDVKDFEKNPEQINDLLAVPTFKEE